MHKLATGVVSVDASVIVDFHLAGRPAVLEELFAGGRLMSDFVEQELIEADIRPIGAQTVALSSTEEWDFFGDLRRGKPGPDPGELGALTVARFQNAILLRNDKQARQTAEEFNVPVHGGLGVLEYAAEAG